MTGFKVSFLPFFRVALDAMPVILVCLHRRLLNSHINHLFFTARQGDGDFCFSSL